MKLCIKIALSWAILTVIVNTVNADADAAAAIDDVLSKVPPDNQQLSTSLEEIKTILTADKPVDYKPKALAVVKSLGKALPNLNSGDGLKIAQGALDIVASIAEQFPGVGTAIAAVASLISAVLGLFTGAKVQKSTADIVREAMRGVSDETLEGEIQGAKDKLTASLDYLRPKKGTKLSAEDAKNLAAKLQITTGLRAIGMVSHRINARKNSNVATEARQSIRFTMLYCQLFTMRDILYREMIDLVKASEAPEEAESLASVRDGRIPGYQDTLKFLAEPEASNAAAVSFYYPPGRDIQSTYIKSCLKFINLPTAPPNIDFLKSGAYQLITMRWPDYVTSMRFSSDWYGYIEVKKKRSNPMYAMKQTFVTDDEGFWHIRYGQQHRTAATDGTWVHTTENVEGDKNKFVIMKLKNGHLAISPKDHPGKLWQVQGSYVGLVEGNPGDQGYFKQINFSRKKSH